MRHATRLVVSLLVVTALAVSFARYVMPPLIETYKDTILAQISAVAGVNVQADGVSVFWHEDGHGFHLQNLRLVNDEGGSDLKAESVYLKFSVLEVLRHLNIAPSEIQVVGTHLAVIRHNDGRVSIHGVEDSGDDVDVDLSAMILQPLFLEIIDSEVTVIDLVHRNSLPLDFSPVNLLLRNDGRQHQLSARVLIDRGESGGFTLISNFQTESDNLELWQGEVYLKTEQLDLAWLLQNRFPGHYELEHAKTSMEIWSRWEKGRLKTLQGSMNSRELHFRSREVREAPEVALDYFGGNFRWTREQNGWLLDVADPLIKHGETQWPTKSIALAIRQIDGQGPRNLYLGADVFSIEGLFTALAVHPPDHPLMQDLFAMQATGEVLNPYLHLKMQRPIEWEFSATLEQLETRASGVLPELRGIRVVLTASQDRGSMKIAGSNASIHLKPLFRQPLRLNQVGGELRWKKQPDGDWILAADNLAASSEDIQTTTSLRYRIPPQGRGDLEIVTDFQKGHVEHAPLYYPAYVMPQKVVQWLERSLVKGFIPSGRFVLQGPLASFPFEDSDDGFYEVLFDVQDAEIAYKEEWPPLKDVIARVRFHGNHLEVNVSEGRIYDNRVGQASMQMQLRPPSPIHLQGDISGALAGPVRLLRETPLKKKFAPLMEALDMQGEGDLSVVMQIPLKKEQAAEFQGELLLKDATINAKNVDLSLQGVNGMLNMSDSGVSASNLKARLLGSPLTMTINQVSDGVTKINAAVDLSAASLKRVIADAPVSGSARWNFAVDVPSLATMRRSDLLLHIRSDLKGMAVDLPLSLGKTRQQKKSLDLAWKLSETAPVFKLGYGDLKMDMRYRQQRWSGSIEAQELAGRLTIPDAKQQQIRVDLERLNLAYSLDDKLAPADKRGKRHTNPHDIRPIHLTSDTLLLNGHPFGELSMNTRHTSSGHEITKLKVISKNDSLVASGSWNLQQGVPTTQLDLSLVAAELGETLGGLDLSHQLEEAQGSIDAKLNWRGSPADFSLSGLDGTLLLDTRKGRFAEAQPGLARVLGFLNIGALKRRLQLDFSDLTRKGFSFDKMRGNFVLNQGVISTRDDLVINAPAADIRVSGDINLGTRRVNQRVRVLPGIHGVLPLAAVAAGGPAVGAALLVAGTVAGEQIDQIVEINYQVSGLWENPDVVRVSRNAGSSEQRNRFARPFDDTGPGSTPVTKRQGASQPQAPVQNGLPFDRDYEDPLADFQ
ncbi:MAG: AsmA-like C-terminal region-containing protein [Pseudomonadota bacterium]